jgi:hypothetical protein
MKASRLLKHSGCWQSFPVLSWTTWKLTGCVSRDKRRERETGLKLQAETHPTVLTFHKYLPSFELSVLEYIL